MDTANLMKGLITVLVVVVLFMVIPFWIVAKGGKRKEPGVEEAPSAIETSTNNEIKRPEPPDKPHKNKERS